MKEMIEWFPAYMRPTLSDSHILAKIKNNVIFSGVYAGGKFVPDQMDFTTHRWEEVEMWCYYPKGSTPPTGQRDD